MKYLYYCALAFCILSNTVISQTQIASVKSSSAPETKNRSIPKSFIESSMPNYFDAADGLSLEDIWKKALEENRELKIFRMDVERAQKRLIQAGLRPNPKIEIEQTSGSLTGSKGDDEVTVGLLVPLEVYGQRGKRVELAKAEIAVKEAEFSARKRLLAMEIISSYVQALSNLRELKMTEEILELDTDTLRFVQYRVNEGDAAPLELNLLMTEVERLRARRILTEGKLQVAISKLKFYAGIDYDKPLKLREEIDSALLPEAPPTIEDAMNAALKNRPEIKLVQLEKEIAITGLRLIRSQSKPDVTAFTRYSEGKSVVNSPRGPFNDSGKLLTFGLSVGLPVFNRNQGAKAEAEIEIKQAEERQIFTERVVRNDVVSAFQRKAAAKGSLLKLESSVLPRSRQTIEVFRQVYAAGELKITDLISEQRRLLEVNRDLIEVLTENYRANTDLLIAVGGYFEN